MSLTDIKSAIQELSEKERCELHAWLQNYPSDAWDLQMEHDARQGKFAQLVREADEAFQKGECRPFP